jgi:hypothetical protein
MFVMYQQDRLRCAVRFVKLLPCRFALPLRITDLGEHRFHRLDICAADAPEIVVEVHSSGYTIIALFSRATAR